MPAIPEMIFFLEMIFLNYFLYWCLPKKVSDPLELQLLDDCEPPAMWMPGLNFGSLKKH